MNDGNPRRQKSRSAIAALAFAALLFGGERVAFAQLGDMLDKAQQAVDAARKAIDNNKNANGPETGSAAMPAAGQSSSSQACLTRFKRSPQDPVRYQNNCGVDLVALHTVVGHSCARRPWAIGKDKSLVPYTTDAVCTGPPREGINFSCECPHGTKVAYDSLPADAAPTAQAAPRPSGRYDQDSSRVRQCVAAARAKNLPEGAGGTGQRFRDDVAACLGPCSADHEEFVASADSGYARKEFVGQCKRSPLARK